MPPAIDAAPQFQRLNDLVLRVTRNCEALEGYNMQRQELLFENPETTLSSTSTQQQATNTQYDTVTDDYR